MGNLFGIRRRAPQVTAQDRAILQLKQQRDKIKIFQKRIEADLEANKDMAIKLFQNGMKDRAIIILRRKKQMETTLSRTDKQLETLEQLVGDIEYTQIEVSVVEGLRVGTEALKQLNSLMSIDDIEQMMEDNAEAAEKQREISAILEKSSERFNEDELLEELEQYKKQSKQVDEPSEVEIAEQEEAAKEETPKKAMITEDADQKSPELSSRSETSTANDVEKQDQQLVAGEIQLVDLPDVPVDEVKSEEPKPKRRLEPAQ